MATPKVDNRLPTACIHSCLFLFVSGTVSALLGVELCGCRTARPAANATYSLSIHRVLAGNSSANHALILEAPNGKTVRVSPNPLLSSAQVVRIEPTDLPGHPRSLRLVLDSAGRFAWMQTRHQHAGELMAVTVDGWFVSIVSLMADGERDDCLILPGPWPETIATSLARRAQLNYEAANNN